MMGMDRRALAALSLLSLGASAAGCGVEGLLAWKLQPSEAFDAAKAPAAPDYSQAEAWAARPEAPGKTAFVPEGVPGPPGDRPVDVFYIHPTTYYGDAQWNASLNNPAPNESLEELILPGQASVFNACCRIFVPRYRQATLGAFLGDGGEGLGAFEIAFADVEAAFAVFLKETGDRPFILASHSQGTLHASGLLEVIDAAPEVRDRMVAAYVPGFRLDDQRFGREYAHITPCEGPEDTGCVVAWDTWIEGQDVPTDAAYPSWSKGVMAKRVPGHTLCVNPISWRHDTEAAPRDAHLGEVAMTFSTPPTYGIGSLNDDVEGTTATGLMAPAAHTLTARCDEDGILRIPQFEDDAHTDLQLGPGNYHILDYRLFYMDIRQNALARSGAFLEAAAAAAAAAEPMNAPGAEPGAETAPLDGAPIER